jgi:hypothetical protein
LPGFHLGCPAISWFHVTVNIRIYITPVHVSAARVPGERDVCSKPRESGYASAITGELFDSGYLAPGVTVPANFGYHWRNFRIPIEALPCRLRERPGRNVRAFSAMIFRLDNGLVGPEDLAEGQTDHRSTRC